MSVCIAASIRSMAMQRQLRLARNLSPLDPFPRMLHIPSSQLSPNSTYIHHSIIFRRNYWYIPLSWEELKMRLRVEREKRVIQVKLLQSTWRHQRNARRMQRKLRRQERNERMVRKLQTSIQEQSQALSKSVTSLWRQTKRRARRPQQLQSLQHPPSQQPQQLTTRDHDWNTLRQVTLTEYNQLDWFDAYGRPLTSRELGTGRYVNPWKSQSTAGVHSLYSILHWRYKRLEREYNQVGWQCLLPASLRTRKTSQVVMAAAAAHEAQQDAGIASESRLDLTSNNAAADKESLVFTWIGHATCLIQQGDLTVLTDPMFSYKASPFQWVPGLGVGRIQEPACRISDLPPRIDVCLISHDHYDHLDRHSVLELSDRVNKWVVPLGIGQWLQDKCDIPAHRIVEMEWWESIRWKPQRKAGGGIAGYGATDAAAASAPMEYRPVEFVSIQDSPVTHPARLREEEAEKRERDQSQPQDSQQQKTREQQLADPSPALSDAPTPPVSPSDSSLWITCCPAQHWSSRTLFDRNLRLWCGFYLVFPNNLTFYFAGDTALPQDFPLFEQLSDYINKPIHLAAIPIGAYEPSFFMRDAHADPTEAVKIHERLHCMQSVGIHWGSFPLSEEDMSEPPQWLERAAHEAHADFKTIPIGEKVVVDVDDDDEEEEDEDEHGREEEDEEEEDESKVLIDKS
ncbi:hypothetical protein MPSEU_000055700 [Mayamaea pseudoterrestris]|nr:hypothetical protein MPSEU_000055700 [Mayamaea pseudoterrestris]